MKTYNNWTLIKDLGFVKHRERRWLCLCACGSKKVVDRYSIVSGKSKSCGCLRRENVTGRKYSNLTAISFVKSAKYGISFWKFKCDCGNIKTLRLYSVKSGSTKSCGCYTAKHRLSNNTIMINRVYSDYKYNANKRKLSFDLEKTDVADLIQNKCFYCRSVKSNVRLKIYGNRSVKLAYNGIDRLNPSIGYKKSNVVSCCSTCNYMKGTLTYSEFIDHIDEISKNLPHLRRP